MVYGLSLNRATEKDPMRKTFLPSAKHPLLMSTTPPLLRKTVIMSNLHFSMEMLLSFLGGGEKCTVTS